MARRVNTDTVMLHGVRLPTDELREDIRTIQQSHAIGAPRPPVNPLARLIASSVVADPTRIAPDLARFESRHYTLKQRERKAADRAFLLSLR